MRKKRTLINTAYTLGSYAVLLVLGLATRSLFLAAFGDKIPGYSGMIESIFSFFAMTELGIGSVISYRLYDKIEQKDAAQIGKYMSLYKWAYRAIGLVIFLLALAVLPFLPLIIKEPDTDWPAVYAIYLIQMLSTLSSYFLVTRRTMYTCTQRGYICTRIDLGINVANSLTRIAIALWLPNYLLWFGVQVVYNTAANLLVARQYKKDFPEIADGKVSLKDFKELGVFHDLRYYLVHRISNAVYGSSDNIVVMRMVGAAAVTWMGNYATISGKVTELFNKLLDAFSAAIGSIVYDRSANADGHARQVFWSLDLFSFFVGSFAAVAYYCLLQPFMAWWMPGRLLPMSFVVAFCLNEYVAWNHRMLGSYRAVLGHFEEDQWYMVASAVSNLVLSFVLVTRWGLAGVVAATVFAHCLMWFGRARVVYRHYMPGYGWRYIGTQALRAGLLVAEMAVTGWLCSGFGSGLAALFGRAMVVCLVPGCVDLLLLWRSGDAGYLRQAAGGAVAKLRRKSSEGDNQ